MKLKLIFAVFLNFLICQSSGAIRTINFPADFSVGAATASYQIEGAWNADGKVPNIWDTVTHDRPWTIADQSTGDEAANSYEFYEKDVQLLKENGFSFYRFSISWSRVIKKTQVVNQAGIDYYNKLIDSLIDNGIEPMVTIYHWDLPQYLQDLGGWPNPMIVKYFEHYADVVFDNFGDRVKTWITFNEPWVFCKVGYAYGEHAPQIRRDGTADYLCGHHMLLSHAKAYHLYKDKYADDQKGEVGICLDTNYYYPINANVTDSYVDKAVQFKFGWFANPIFSTQGGYPAEMKEAIDRKSIAEGRRWSRLPEFTDAEKTSLIGSADFLAMNYYTSNMVIPYHMSPGKEDWSSDNDLHTEPHPSWQRALSNWLYFVPQGLKDILVWIKDHYNNPRVVISENGWSDDLAPDVNGIIADDGRIKYLQHHLGAVYDAKAQGCNVDGFTVWSIIDNFEWARGYTEKFGIHYVDFSSPNKTRTPKNSALFFKDFITNHKSFDYDEEVVPTSYY